MPKNSKCTQLYNLATANQGFVAGQRADTSSATNTTADEKPSYTAEAVEESQVASSCALWGNEQSDASQLEAQRKAAWQVHAITCDSKRAKFVARVAFYSWESLEIPWYGSVCEVVQIPFPTKRWCQVAHALLE